MWDHAREHDFVIVSKDSDFRERSYLEGSPPKVVWLKSHAQVVESQEGKPGVILDFDADGDLVSLEVLDASRRVTDARRVEFQTMTTTEP